jgi:hypothetical protein
LTLSLVTFTVILFATGTAVGQETFLYSFGDSGTEAHFPAAGPIMEAAGNIYGVT